MSSIHRHSPTSTLMTLETVDAERLMRIQEVQSEVFAQQHQALFRLAQEVADEVTAWRAGKEMSKRRRAAPIRAAAYGVEGSKDLPKWAFR